MICAQAYGYYILPILRIALTVIITTLVHSADNYASIDLNTRGMRSRSAQCNNISPITKVTLSKYVFTDRINSSIRSKHY